VIVLVLPNIPFAEIEHYLVWFFTLAATSIGGYKFLKSEIEKLKLGKKRRKSSGSRRQTQEKADTG